MLEQSSDKALISRIAKGDKGAMKVIYDRYANSLRKFVSVRFVNPTEAADVVQDTFMAVWRTADRFEGRSSVKSWIFRIARNKSIDSIRKNSRLQLGGVDSEILDETPDPFDLTAAVQDAAILRDCIKKLSDAHRTAIHLAFFEDLPYKNIAEIEECSDSTIKTRIFHAKKLLMHCVTKDDNAR